MVVCGSVWLCVVACGSVVVCGGVWWCVVVCVVYVVGVGAGGVMFEGEGDVG